jgi:hypothetical protein
MYTQTIAPQLCQVDEAPFQKTREASYNLYPGMWLRGEKDVRSGQVKDSISQLWARDVAEEQARQIERLMSEGKYREAVVFGQTVHGDQTPSIETGKDDSRLARAEINLHYARALVYTGATMEGTALYKAILADEEAGQNPEDVTKQGEPHSLKGSRRNYVLGRAHNDLGYAYLVELGHYALALQELKAALLYFRTSNLWDAHIGK